MQFIRIFERGFETYTGHLHQVEFKDGVSVEPVPDHLVSLIGGIIRVAGYDPATGDDLGQVGSSVDVLNVGTVMADVVDELNRATEDELVDEAKAAAANEAREAKRRQITQVYAREDLERIADETGIKGLRKIGDLFEVRGRAIPDLIEDILRAQELLTKKQSEGEAEPVEPEPAPEPMS